MNIEKYINQIIQGNCIVLDPMCGSGTTCKSAYELERKYIGIDISAEYCNLAKERINTCQLQPTLELGL